MTGEIENAERNNNRREAVTSVGNSWVICNSKSRPGLKYYFNTYTGQAVWNLSPTEIEKAQGYTKGLPISEIEKCPEPTDPPMDPPMNPSQSPPARTFNDQIINNQFPNQITSMFPVNFLNGIPGVSGINPNAWNIPPSNAAIAPTPQVIYFAYQPPMNFQPSQEYPTQLPRQFQNNEYDAQEEISQNVHTNFQYNRGKKMFNCNRGNRIHNNGGRSRFSQHVQNKWNNNSTDLRQKLTRKRSKSQSCEPDSHRDAFYQFDNDGNIGLQMNKQEETPSKYDLSTLKMRLKLPQSKLNSWFIVVDTEIILNNFQFLNKITDPDQDCYLMVPDHVITKLEQLAFSGGDVLVQRVYRFLSAQIDSAHAFRGENMNDLEDNDTDKTFATCVELATDHNVILLSNNIKLYKYINNNNNVHVLTLNELKLMLNGPVKQAPTISKSPTLDIKILVPNDSGFERNKKNSSSLLTSKRPDLVTPHVAKKKDTNTQINSVPFSSRQTIDSNAVAGHSESCLDEVDRAPMIINTLESVRFEKSLENSNICNNEKKKEIKLSRCYSNQKTNPEVSTQIKQFRWRKQRRNANTKMNESKSSFVKSDSPANINRKVTTSVANKKTDSNLFDMSRKATNTAVRAPSLDRSSISSHSKRSERPNITIEETSTSGVISNTTLDCESVNSNSEGKLKKTISVCDDVNFEMFQVGGQAMEEVLRTRREEWVLRFVQIMEEVLREKLRDDSPFQSKDYAPPWATDLPELARCIIKKYSDHFNVVDAANRLSFTLQRISDNKGNVSANLEPGQYMDMYSFGVYLVQSLKSVTNDCEDLNTAEESLKKLLDDIQNASLDCSHNDNFDELNESAIHATEPIYAEEHLPQSIPPGDSIEETHEEDHSERQSSSKNSYMLRSRKKTPTKIVNEPPQQKKITNVETTFFSSLELAKRLNPDNKLLGKRLDFQDTPSSTPVSTKIAQTPPQVSLSPKTSQRSPGKQSEVKLTSIQERGDNTNKEMFSGNDDIGTKTGDQKENPSTAITPCFVRNFTSIAQFEKKLSNKQLHEDEEEYTENSYDADTAFADVYYDEHGQNYVNVNELEDGEIADLEDVEIADLNDGQISDNTAVQNTLNIEGKLKDSEIDNNKKFRSFINEFIGEIKESLEAVQKLCSEFVEDFKNSQESSLEMKSKLRTACATMFNMSNILNSILDRESTRPENNIMLLLKKANLVDFVPNEELRLEYRDNISKCKDQAYNCYKVVSLIMKRAGI